MPTAAPTICCSEMYIWKKRSGYASPNFSVKVELPTSPSMATTSGRAPSAASASPKAARVATFMPISYLGRVIEVALARLDRRRPRGPRRRLDPAVAHAAELADGGLGDVGRQRLAVPAGRILDLRYTFTLDGARQDDGRLRRALRQGEGVVDLLEVVPVDHHGAAAERLDAPPVRLHVPLQLGRPRLAEPVHVDDRREVVQTVVRRLVEGLPDGALGQLAVAAQHPDAVAGLVEPLAGQRDPDAVGEALAEGPGGHVDPGQRRRRVALQRGPRAPVGLRQLAVVDHAHGLVQRVEQGRGVSLGEDQVVVVVALGLVPVVVQVPGEQHGHEVGCGQA